MKTMGIFEAKTKFSEICDMVDKSKEPILITKRGVPVVKINPVINTKKSEIWNMREKFIKENGEIDIDIPIPKRKIDDFKNILKD